MFANESTWSIDWQQRLRNRLHRLGCETIADFLRKRPAVPYVALAKELGENVAAVQLGRLQLQEVRNAQDFRVAAMDSLAREISANLPNGWQLTSDRPKPGLDDSLWIHLAAKSSEISELEQSDRIEFQTAGAYAYWLTFVRSHDQTVEPRAAAVWAALKALSPSPGWIPKGPDDPLIVRAFEIGWPESATCTLSRQDFRHLCPKCKAVLMPPSDQISELVCPICSVRIELV